MKNNKSKNTVLLLITLCIVAGQAFAEYKIRKHTINSGGSKMTGGSYEMKSSIAQVDAGTMTEGDYSLNAGFWQENNDLIFKNGFE